jgi:hypothetical protein
MMDQNVPLPDRGKNILRILSWDRGQPGNRRRGQWRVFEIGSVDRHQVPKVFGGQRSIDDIEVVSCRPKVLDQPIAHVAWHRAIDHQPHDRAERPLRDRLPHDGHEVDLIVVTAIFVKVDI